MSRLSVPDLESDTGPTAEVYAQIKKAIGNVPNTFAAIGAHGPAALKSICRRQRARLGRQQARSGNHQARDQRASPAVTTASPRTAISASSPG